MKLTLTLFVILAFSYISITQTIVWNEDFSSGLTGWTQYAPPGSEGASANLWYATCNESNTGLGSCSKDCNSAVNKTLHIGMKSGVLGCSSGDCGATYLTGGPCITNKRIESPSIDLSLYTHLTLSFSYIEGGNGISDNASCWFFDGISWSLLFDTSPTLASTCSAGESTWTTFTITLPASANNNPNVKIGFLWVNNDDNIPNPSTTPISFAVDDIKITPQPPKADFTASKTNLCQNNCVSFVNTSTYDTNPFFSWIFGDGQTSNLKDPGEVCYASAGSYNVSLTVTDKNGTNTKTINNLITVTSRPNAGSDNTMTACNNNSINLSTLLISADPGGLWKETTSQTSGRLNSSTATFDASCLSEGIYTFDYIVTKGICNDTSSFSIEIISCGAPTADINASKKNGCVGKPIIFTDLSCGAGINSWLWSFGGGIPGTANTKGPHSVVFNSPGVYNVFLEVANNIGSDNQIIQVTISGCGAPIAAFNPDRDTVCNKSCISFNSNSITVGPTTYLWTFEGGTPDTSYLENPGLICYDTLGFTDELVDSLKATLTVTNTFGKNTFTQLITVVPPPRIDTVCCPEIVEMGTLVGLSAKPSAGSVTWSWIPDTQGDIMDCVTENCDSINTYPLISTDFFATTTTKEGCQATGIVKVLVNYETAIGVPNTFSPNGNDINDLLSVKGIGISDLDFKIYNRYGQLVFQTSKIASEWQGPTGWDGTFKGKAQQNGTFLYMLNYTLINGESGFLSGNVTLIR
jgi:gliding motility-associated-like protein